MRVTNLTLNQFRCFEQASFIFNSPIVLLEGDNGSGKTSVLEALYYACYVRSFRTHMSRELVRHGSPGCSVQVAFVDHDKICHELRVGLQPPKRRVRLDGKAVQAYDELLSCMRVVAITDSDAQLVRGGPEGRRAFIDEYILVHEPEFLGTLKSYAALVKQRNALLQNNVIDECSFAVWTRKVWEQAVVVQEKRLRYTCCLQEQIKKLCALPSGCQLEIQVRYLIKKPLGATYEEFQLTAHALRAAEQAVGYSLFGAHFDDIIIRINDARARSFASRGQQKAVTLLLKIAQAHELVQRYGGGVVLLDDVMLDFDDHMLKLLIEMLVQLPVQLIFTSAQGVSGALQRVLALYKPQIIRLAPGENNRASVDLIAKSSLLPYT